MQSEQSTDSAVVRRAADHLGLGYVGHFRRRPDDRQAGDAVAVLAARGARNGDPDSLRYLYLRYADNVYGYVCSIVRDEHEAEDVTQQIFTRLVSALRCYEPTATPFSAWIIRVAHNAAVDVLRARRPVPSDAAAAPEPLDPRRSHEHARDIASALATLTPDQRHVIILRFLYGLTPAEIATELGRSEGAVNGLQHRGRNALRRALTALDRAPATRRGLVAAAA